MNRMRVSAAIISLGMLGSIGGYFVSTAENITLMASAADEHSGTCGENVTWTFDESTGTLTISGTGAMEDCNAYLLQLSSYSEYADLIKNVIIEEGITRIGSESFFYYENIEDFTFPKSLTEIGIGALDGTAWLAARQAEDPCVVVNGILYDASTCEGDVTVPDTVKVISDGAFSGSNITGVTIPEGIPSIPARVLSGCSKLTSVTLPESLTSIGDSAFSWCDVLEEIVIPAGVTSIGLEAFETCPKLRSVTILNQDCEIYDLGTTICESTLYNDDYTLVVSCPYSGVIKGYTGSTAEAYAKKYDRTFVAISDETEQPLGDLNGDNTVNASDAAQVLIAAAAIGAGQDSGLTEAQKNAADVNHDSSINASDAAVVLIYAAAIGAGQDMKIEDFVH